MSKTEETPLREDSLKTETKGCDDGCEWNLDGWCHRWDKETDYLVCCSEYNPEPNVGSH